MYSRRSEDNSRNGGPNSGTDDPPMSRKGHRHAIYFGKVVLVWHVFFSHWQVYLLFAINQTPPTIFVRHSKNLAKSKRFIVWKTEIRAIIKALFTSNTARHRKRLMHSKKWTEKVSAYRVVPDRWKSLSHLGKLNGLHASQGRCSHRILICFGTEFSTVAIKDRDDRTMNKRNMFGCLSLCRRDWQKMNYVQNSPNMVKSMPSQRFATKLRANARDSLMWNISSKFAIFKRLHRGAWIWNVVVF